MHVRAYKASRIRDLNPLPPNEHGKTVTSEATLKFVWNGKEYKTPKTFTVKPNVEQKVTFYYRWFDEAGLYPRWDSMTVTKTFDPGEVDDVAIQYETWGPLPLCLAYLGA